MTDAAEVGQAPTGPSFEVVEPVGARRLSDDDGAHVPSSDAGRDDTASTRSPPARAGADAVLLSERHGVACYLRTDGDRYCTGCGILTPGVRHTDACEFSREVRPEDLTPAGREHFARSGAFADPKHQDRLGIPGAGNWTFQDERVAADFDRHVREQLPWYDLATGLVAQVGRHFVPEGGSIVDVGCSTGNVARALGQTIADRKATYFGIDASQQMVDAFAPPPNCDAMVARADARKFNYEQMKPDLIVCFLVLMFVPPKDRAALIYRMKTALNPGGALLVFDKLQPAGGEVGALTMRLTLGAKYEAGAPADEIIAKELSLAGVQRPLADWELRDFSPIFRFGDFGGWLFVDQTMDLRG